MSDSITQLKRSARLRRARIAGSIFFAMLGWVIFPSLRAAVADATLRLELGEPWLSLFYLPVRWRAGTAALGYAGWTVVVALVSILEHLRLIRLPEYQSLEAYFLVRAATLEPLRSPNPAPDGC